MPPRPERRHLLAGVAFVLFAAGWVAAAAYLWQTSQVPDGLHLPEVEPRAYFTARELERASDYETFVRIDLILLQVALVATLGLYAAYGARLARESAAGRIGTGMLLGMLGLAFFWIVQLPFGLARLWWARRHEISREDYLPWIVDNWLGLGSEFLFICLALLIVMGLAALLRRHWWVLGGPVFVGLALLFAFLLPYLIPDQRPLRDPGLRAEAGRLARAEDVDVPVRVQEVQEDTTAPNAEAAGLGPSQRVILWDTLLDGRFEDDEIRFVLAHEFAHVARDHIWKGVGWYALFAVPGAFLIALATRRRGGLYEPRAVPLALFVLVVLQSIALPVENLVSRRLEAEADWVALQTTRDPAAARALFQRLSITSLTAPNPPTWSYLLIDSHPTMIQRLAMAEAWQARQRQGR